MLVNDIDVSGVNWTPIGDRHDAAFSGSIDGDGYTVKLSFSGQYRGPQTAISASNTKGDGFGLFGWATGNFTAKNLVLDVNFDLTTQGTEYASYVAGLVGIYDAAANGRYYNWSNSNNSTYDVEITNVTVTGSIKGDKVAGIMASNYIFRLRIY